MLDLFSSAETVGIELNPDEFLLARATLNNGSVRLLQLQKIPLVLTNQENGNIRLSYPAGTAPLALNPNSISITSLKSSEVLVRNLEIKLTKDKDIQAVLPFQVEPLLPYPMENAILNSMKIGGGKDFTLLSIFSARKDYLKELLQNYESLGINPEVVSSTPAALAAFAYFFKSSSGQASAIFHIGYSESSCVLAREGKVLSSQTLSGGILALAAFLAADTGLSETEALQRIKKESVIEDESAYLQYSNAVNNLGLNLSQQLFSVVKQNKSIAVSQVFLTGNAVHIAPLREKVKKIIGSPISVPVSRDGLSSSQLEEYAVPIGLGISALSNFEINQDFRQQEFTYPYPWQRYKKSLYLYFGACLFFAFVIWILGSVWSGYEEDKVKQGYSAVLSSLDKPYSSFEKEYYEKFLKTPLSENIKTPSLKSLSQNDLMARLLFLQEQAQQTPETFPLLPNTPRVSDILAWLSTHAQVVKNNGKSSDVLLNLESFNYQMVKKPDQSKKQERYQVRVELEFTTSIPKLAREFHDALIAPNDIVDPKGEIKWSSNRDSYRTSFYLKDKTIYPIISTGK